MLYKNDRGANDAAHPPEGGPFEAGSVSDSGLPLLDNAVWGQKQLQINAVGHIYVLSLGLRIKWLYFLQMIKPFSVAFVCTILLKYSSKTINSTEIMKPTKPGVLSKELNWIR